MILILHRLSTNCQVHILYSLFKDVAWQHQCLFLYGIYLSLHIWYLIIHGSVLENVEGYV